MLDLNWLGAGGREGARVAAERSRLSRSLRQALAQPKGQEQVPLGYMQGRDKLLNGHSRVAAHAPADVRAAGLHCLH
eukprot:364496-Chlamydomonas_euryale.AAC.48